MRRLLIVAYYFPPIGGIGSIRMARFATLLPELGWEPTVIAARDTPHFVDPSLGCPADKVVRARSVEFSKLGRALLGGPSGRPLTGGVGAHSRAHAALRVAAHRYAFYPDAQVGWYPGAVLAGLRMLRRTRFDAIYSSSNPITAHLVARTLARRSGLPWVAEFRDPWSDRLADDHPHRRRGGRLEDAIAARATRIVVPTPGLRTFLGERWGTDIALIPNGHDLGPPSDRRPDRPTLTHVGTFYPGAQSFRGLWTALQQRMRAGRRDSPQLRFVGELPAELRQEVESAGLGHLLEETGLLPHDDAMRAMASSTMLIASGFGGDDPVSLGVIPAKLFEYLASGLPILYLGDAADDAARLLGNQPGCFVVDPANVAGVLAALDAGLSGPIHRRDVEPFSRRARARALAHVLARAAGSADETRP